MKAKIYGTYLPGLLLLAGTFILGYLVRQSDAALILTGYGLAFAGYAAVLGQRRPRPAFWIAAAIALRLLLLFAFPALSDDVYRFIWDGRLWAAGLNPFDQLPGYYLQPGHAVPGLDQALFDRLNSPSYHTIYPPVAQGIFALAARLSPGSWYGAMLVMKGFLLLCELGSLWLIAQLLLHYRLPSRRLLLYALNPLILVEITGNLHFEGAMVFFLLAGWYAMLHRRWIAAGVLLAGSVAAKLLSLLLLPLLLRRVPLRHYLPLFGAGAVALLLAFGPLLSGFFLDNFGSSLDLYFRRFEFNGSLYYLARRAGFEYRGYNLIATIGPALAVAAGLSILLLAALERRPDWRNLARAGLWAVCIFLFCTTTVHPWYLCLPVLFCLFTPYRFPLWWSALIVLTYVNYSFDPYREVMWIVGLEYGLLLLIIVWELRANALRRSLSGQGCGRRERA